MSTPATQAAPEPPFGDLYRALCKRLEQIVRADAQAPDAIVEDACQHAWGRLLAPRTRIHPEAALSWLATTAVREARRLMRVCERDVSLDADQAGTRPGACAGSGEHAELPAGTRTEMLVEEREQLRLMRHLPERQQRLMWLHALGLSYQEIADYTGDTTRTVERQLLRGRRRIRQLAV